MTANFQSESYWSEAWVRHIEAYLAAPPRAGIWLARRLSLHGKKVLEIAGGSCRDSRYLASQGVDATGSDFDQSTLDYVSQKLRESALKIQREDAFAFSFPDKHFDVTFHNGFWVCFRNDADVEKLLREQARITREIMVVLVHNADNPALRQRFADKARTDNLYDIRFFNRHELSRLCEASGLRFKSLRLAKFGGPVDRLYRLLGRLPAPLGRRLKPWLPSLYALQPWSKVERIALLMYL